MSVVLEQAVAGRLLDSGPMTIQPNKASEDKIRDFEQQAIPLMPQLYGAALRWTRNPSDAEDLVQEAMAKAFVAWAQYRQVCPLLVLSPGNQ